jgi:hypothetical protein
MGNMSNTVKNPKHSKHLSISDVARLFRIEKSIRTNVMKALLNLEEARNTSLNLNFCNFYAVISEQKLQEALGLKELPEAFLTPKEAAQELNITDRRVRNLINNGRLENYAKDFKREILLDPKEVLAVSKTIRPRLKSEIFTTQQSAQKKRALPRKNLRENIFPAVPETEEERKLREIEIAKIRAKDESYRALERSVFIRRV